MGPKDYYNVDIFYTNAGKTSGVQLKALTEVEVRQYFDYVKKGFVRNATYWQSQRKCSGT